MFVVRVPAQSLISRVRGLAPLPPHELGGGRELLVVDATEPKGCSRGGVARGQRATGRLWIIIGWRELDAPYRQATGEGRRLIVGAASSAANAPRSAALVERGLPKWGDRSVVIIGRSAFACKPI